MGVDPDTNARDQRREEPASPGTAADALAEVMPNARRRTLDGQSHNVSMKVLARGLTAFFTNESETG